MKKSIFLAFLLTIINALIYAQPYLQHRGMYVDGFIKFRDVNASGSNLVVDQNRSILGVDIDGFAGYEKEIELVNYCKANHITYIVLYDCNVPLAYPTSNYRVSTADPGTHTFGWHICRFINFCRQNCIDMIGVAGSLSPHFDNIDNFNNSTFPQMPPTPPFQFPSSFQSSPLASTLNFVTQNVQPNDPQFEEVELTKLFLRAAFLPSTLANCAHVDVLNLESEYWNTNSSGGPSTKWQPWQGILNHMNDIKHDNNDPTICPTCSPVYTEVYLGLLDNNDASGIQNEIAVGNFIDGNNVTHASQKQTDRILTHYYLDPIAQGLNPSDVYKNYSATNYYTKRFITFGNNNFHDSKIRPIFSSETELLGAPDDFYGPWLQQDIKNNIFTAESQFYDSWMADAYHLTTPSTAAADNSVKPGASQWFTSRYMLQALNNPSLFRSNPIFSSGSNGNVGFTFQGPIENEEEWNGALTSITYKFWVTDNSGSVQYYPTTPGVPSITTVPYLKGNTSLNPGATIFNIDLPTSVACTTISNNSAPHIAHLEISYPNSGCTLLYEQDVMVANGPSIISLSPLTNVCSGQSVFLRASTCSGTTNYQWYRDDPGGDIPVGTNNKDFQATVSGDYYCILSGGVGACYGTTNIINVIVNEIPVFTITALCTGPDITLSPSIVGSGTYDYLWSDDNHSTTSSLTIPYPNSGNNTYSVRITTQGTECSDVNTISLPFKISVTTTGTPCQGNSITLSAPANGNTGYITEALGTYSWTPGSQNTPSINVTSNGIYSVTAIGATSQCKYFGSKLISFSPLPNASVTTTGPLTYCQGDPINTTLSVGFQSNYSYQWKLNNNNIGANSNSYPIPNGAGSGSYTVTVTNTTTTCSSTSAPVILTVNSLPTPSISGSNDPCINSIEPYSTQTGQSNYVWSASSGGTVTGSGNLINVTWNSFGAQTVSVTYTDQNGCTPVAPTVFNVNVRNLPTVTLNPFNNVCTNTTAFTLTGGSPSGGSYYIDGNTNPSVSFDPSALSQGTHTITYSYTDGFGCMNSASQNININPQPNPNITGLSTVCAGTTNVSYTATPSGSGISYLWNAIGGTFLSTTTNPFNVDWGTSGSGQVQVTITDGNNCSNNTSLNVNINTSYTQNLILNPLQICQGTQNVTLDVDPASVLAPNGTYAWTYTPVGTTNTQPISSTSSYGPFTVTAAGDEYELTYTTTYLCAFPQSVTTLLIVSSCQGMYDPFAYPVSFTPSTCPNFNNGSITAGLYNWNTQTMGPYDFHWTLVGSSSVFTGTTISNLAPGTYIGTAWNPGMSQPFSNISTITVIVPGVNTSPTPTITTNHPGYTCATNLTTGNYASYNWQSNTGFSANSQNITAPNSGTYTVTVADQNGCTGSATQVVVKPNAIISGSLGTCNSNFSVPVNANGANYMWSVPTGCTFTQNQNSINVNWGTVITTGGTISCTVTNACGDIVIGSVLVYPLNLTIASTLTCAGMNSGTAGVNSITGHGPYSYHWNNNSNSPLINSLAAGQYSVTVTDQFNGCTATANTTVGTLPTNIPTPVITGTLSASPGAHTYTITNYNSGYDNYYTWLPIANSGNPIVTSGPTKQTVSIQWPSSGGRIEVSFGVNGCKQTNIYYVQPYCQNTYTYDDGSTQTNITSSNSITRNNMTFNGVLEITDNFTFSGCGQVSFAPGAKIIVKANKTLTINNCTFTASNNCCKMWRGIVLEPGAIINISNSTIAQAEVGITVNAGCTYTVSGCHFKDNYIGMQIGTGSIMTTSGSTIRNTEFYSCSYTCGGTTYSSFVLKYDGQSTNPGTYPLAGILIDNCTYFKIGNLPNVSGGDIKFHELSNGIIASNSNLYLSNFSCKNMIADATYSSLTGQRNGCGIKTTGGYVNVIGLGGVYNSDITIANSSYGFAVEKGNAEIQHVNTEADTKIGVFVTNTHEFSVYENCFKTNLLGVWTYANPDASITITKNDFRMSNTIASHACIRHDEFNQPNYINVSENTMKLYKCKFGIFAFNVGGGQFKTNTIEMNNNGNVAGIVGLGLHSCTFKCNTINAFQNYSNPQYGMYFGIGSNNAISCNWMNRQQHGLYISSAFNDALIQGNSFNNHSIGLGLYYNPNISPQYWGGNTWNGNFSQYGAYHSQIDANLADANRFYYDPNGSSNNHPQTTNDPGFNWFVASSDMEDFSCANFACQPTIPREEEGNEGDVEVAENNPPGDPVEQTSNYLADKFLFKKLEDNPDLLTGNPILQAFYNQQVNGSIGQFNEMTQEISDAVRWESVYALVYTTNQSMMENKTDSIDSLSQADPMTSLIEDMIHELNNQVRTLSESNEFIYQTIQQITEYRITNALYGNSNLPSTEAYEYNQRIINEIYLNTVAQGRTTFTTSQLNHIINIMEQCPYTGGPAVYTARSLYSMVDNTINWNDEAICATSGVLPRLRKPENGFTVYPNPSTGIITVNYSIHSESRGYIEILNTLGEKISFVRLNPDEKSTTVDLSLFKPAIYFYKIIVNDELLERGSLSIVR